MTEVETGEVRLQAGTTGLRPHQVPGKKRQEMGYRVQKDPGPADTLALDFQPLELPEKKLLLSKPPSPLALCYSSLR